jgi:RHS repeat-associated protein
MRMSTTRTAPDLGGGQRRREQCGPGQLHLPADGERADADRGGDQRRHLCGAQRPPEHPAHAQQRSGQAVWQWSYSAFGEDKPTVAKNRFANLDTTPNPGTTNISEVKFNLRYPGQYADEESGLFYNYFRSYDSRTGRYSQPDPIGLDGGWNRATYVDANPLIYTDPMGLVASTDPWFGQGGDLGFKEWWHQQKGRGVWFCETDEGFNKKKPLDIPNKQWADALKAEYDAEKAEKEAQKQEKKSGGKRPQRERGEKRNRNVNEILKNGGGGRGGGASE